MRGKILAMVEALTARFEQHHAFLRRTMLARAFPTAPSALSASRASQSMCARSSGAD
jgi:hypothetical protein